ncbi:MAG: radical SAM protein [Candidatus Omnitrophica bacterium]|nr:radical SAM protein [Candidatus Omnitrophota bacterium]
MKKIIFYYHHFGGYGHGMRIYSICKALQSIGKYKIWVINSGTEQPELGIDRYAKVFNLPPVIAAESLFEGLNSGTDIHKTLAQRQMLLKKIAAKFGPDLAVIEHFPFGRMGLENEILGFIGELKRKDCKVYSSVRDLILTKGKQEHFGQFKGIFIHEDPHFNHSSDAPGNSVFTGRVHPYGKSASGQRGDLRKSLDLGSKKLIVASIGGGLDGHELLAKLADIKPRIDDRNPCVLMVFTGKSFPDEKWTALEKGLPRDCRLIRFHPDLMGYVDAADLFISMGGYNSVNSHLLTDTPSMIFPRLSDDEQQVRADQYGFKCYDYVDISPDELLAAIGEKLTIASEIKKTAEMNGAQRTARLIAKALELKRAKIRVKTKCDLNCSMCSWKDKDEQLEEQRIYAVLDDLAMLSVEMVNFTGGEPTAFAKLELVMDYAKHKGFQVSLSTNGFNQKALERIVPYLDHVDISIDSHLEHLHDAIRGRKGAYAATLKSIEYLSAKGIQPHINVTVRPDNYKGLHQLISDLSTQISSISFTLVDTSMNREEELIFSYKDLEAYYFDEVLNIFKESVTYSVPVRITPSFDDLLGLNSPNVLAEMVRHREKYFSRFHEIFTLDGKDCQIAKEQIRINANGNVRPCCYLDDEHIPFGNINSIPLTEIVTGDKYFDHTLNVKEGVDVCSVCRQGYAGYRELCLSKV